MNQLIVNILISWMTILLVSLGFSLIYKVVRFFPIAHAVIFTSGAYFSFLFIQILGWSFFVAIPTAIIAACLIGCIIEWFVYRPLRKKKSSAIILLLASSGN